MTGHENGPYDVGRDFVYLKKANEHGVLELTRDADINKLKEHFLKPKHVMWASNPHIKRVVTTVGLGSYHMAVAARDPGDIQAKLYTSGLNSFGQLGHGDAGKDTHRHALTLVRDARFFNPYLSCYVISAFYNTLIF
jgi:hypothetical protein